MSLGDLQFYDLIIFVGIAAFLIFRLRNVLGKRTGFQKNNSSKIKNENKKFKEHKKEKNIPQLDDNIVELKKAYENLDSFNHKSFIDGAKLAFETIINAFNSGDKKTLKNLLTNEVFDAFEEEINKNNIDSESQIFSLNIEKIESVLVDQDKISIKIKFISEKFKNNDESTITKNEDIWTFEKPIKSKDPNWFLAST